MTELSVAKNRKTLLEVVLKARPVTMELASRSIFCLELRSRVMSPL
jgi:hypothetical protein